MVKQTGRRILSVVLCVVMLVLIYPMPASAADARDGANAIHSVSMDVGSTTAFVQVTSEGNSILIVAVYSESGRMQDIGTTSITEPIIRQNVPVTVSCMRETGMTLKAFVLDSVSYTPLCASVSDDGTIGSSVFSVVFLPNDGSDGCWDIQLLEVGDCASQPSNPEREQYGFTGWYTESASVTKYDFSTPVEGNLILYAGWGSPDGSPGLYSADSDGKTVYSVTGITMSKNMDEVNVTCNVNSAAALMVDFLDEETKEVLFTVGTATPDYAELETLVIPLTESLPDYFLIHAHLENEEGVPLCEDYECITYTSQYAEFAALTVEDFAGEPVVNFDNDPTDNFGVLQNDVIWLQSTDSLNTLTVEEIEVDGEIVPDFRYVFTNADETVKGLRIGDKVYVEGTSYLFKVAELTLTDDEVILTASGDLDVTEVYDVLKVNIFNLDITDQNTDTSASLMADIDINVSPSTKISHSINWNPGGRDWLTVTGSYSAEVKCDISFLYDIRWFQDNYLKASVVTDVKTTFNVSAKAKTGDDGDDDMHPVVDELSFGKIPLQTPVPGVTVYIKAEIPTEWKLEGEASLQYSSTQKTGFTYDSFSGRQNVDKKTRTLKVDFSGKAEISIGPKIEAGVQFIGETIKANVSAQAGIKATAKLDLSAGQFTDADSRHACVLCLDGEAKWFVTVDAGLSVKIGNWKANIFDVNLITLEGWIDFGGITPGKFFFSIVNDDESIYKGEPKRGFGECENKQYRTTFEAADVDGNPIDVKISVQHVSGKKTDSKNSPFNSYLYSGIYTASATINGTAVTKTFTVDGAAQTVSLTPDSADGKLTGNVVDAQTGDPLSGVSVVVAQGDQKFTASETNGRGVFSFDLPAGSVSLRLSKEGYTAHTCYITILDGEIRDMGTIRLVSGSGKGGFSGQITDATTGDPVEGVTLKLRAGWNNSGNGDVLRTLTTDSDGRFEYNMVKIGSFIIHGLDTGNYTLTASKAGYSNSSFNVVVYPDVITPDQDGTISPDASIPDDAVYFNDHAYKLYDQSTTWTEARSQCESVGGHLASITSEAEELFIENLLQCGSKRAYWLGATDVLTEGSWAWITDEVWSYTNWDSTNHQPDNSDDEDYLQIYNPPAIYSNVSAYKWNDQSNNNSNYSGISVMGYICEWEL